MGLVKNALTKIVPRPNFFRIRAELAFSASAEAPWDLLKERNGLTTMAPGPNLFFGCCLTLLHR